MNAYKLVFKESVYKYLILANDAGEAGTLGIKRFKEHTRLLSAELLEIILMNEIDTSLVEDKETLNDKE